MEDDLSSIAPLRQRITHLERGLAEVLQHLTALAAENAKLQAMLAEMRLAVDAVRDPVHQVERPRSDGRREAQLSD